MIDHLTISDRLYGRNREMVTLLESFGRTSRGSGEVLLVPGYSGVGKTSLIQELRVPVHNMNGIFISGKFDQYQQNIPYVAFRQALAQLCQKLQHDDEHQRIRYKAVILEAVGDMGQLLVDIVPEFETFLGPQPPMVDISPQEARHRFAKVFLGFLKVFCLPEHPLVIFIDDCQWADAASLELLKQMQIGGALRYLLVVASYRDNEVHPSHLLISTVDYLRSTGVSVEVLHVGNISVNDVQALLADTLKPAVEDIEELAVFIYDKTLGNPFFVRSFLSYLHEFDLLCFDLIQNCWQWSKEKINEADLPNNVVELYVKKLRRFDADVKEIFTLAACLGNSFDLVCLSLVSGLPIEECLTMLYSDQAVNMLQPLNTEEIISHSKNISAPSASLQWVQLTHPLRGMPGKAVCIPIMCKFLHDRVQQAAYSLIEPEELSDVLLYIGRQLLAHLSPEHLADKLFDVLGAMNAAYHKISDTAEQVTMVELNITAARKAYAATAYSAALQFYRSAHRFLERQNFAEFMWSNHHKLTIELFKESAECEFLEGNYARAESFVQQSVSHAGNAIDEADAIKIRIVHYTLLARYPAAIAAGRQALAALDVILPDGGYEKARSDEIALFRQELGDRPVSSLFMMPVMSNPKMLMAAKILITMGPPCYRSHQMLWSVIVPKVVNLTLRYGNIPEVGYSHTAFGGLLGWVDNDYDTAREFGDLATNLMEKTFRSPSDLSVFYLMVGSSIHHWFRHLIYSTQDYMNAYKIGLNASNMQYAAYAFGHNMYCRFYQGVALEDLIQESQRSLSFSRIRLNQWAIDLLEGGISIFSAISGENSSFDLHDKWSEEEYLQQVEDHHNIQVTCIYKILKTFSLMLKGDYEHALTVSDEVQPLIYTVGTQGLLPWPEHIFARMMILTALWKKADETQRTKWYSEFDGIMSSLRIWAYNCPANYKHKYYLAAAELACIDGRSIQAAQHYDEAIEAAQDGKFLQWEGIANERAYDFWAEYGNERYAHLYWQQAYVCYYRWGANAKVRSMEIAYKAYLANKLHVNDEFGKPVDTLEHYIETAMLEKRINQLRNYAIQMQQLGLEDNTVAEADEMAQATERLRVEIAERKRVEDALRESEERFKALFQHHSAVKLVIDLNTGDILDANNAAVRYYGWSIDELKHMSIYQINTLTPEDVTIELGKARSGEKNNFEFRHRRADGSIRDVEVFSNSIEIAGKTVLYSIIHDITERKQIEVEMAKVSDRDRHIANRLQELLIPPLKPMQPVGYEIAAKYQPALLEAEVCGDFYDIIDLNDGKIGIVIGDIMGKGLQAAAHVSVVINTIRSYAYLDHSPSSVMTRVNDALCRQTESENETLTMFYAVLDTHTGELTYANAGHEPPLLRHSDGSVELITDGGPMISGLAECSYLEYSVDFQEGYVLVLLTDGIAEARVDNHSDLFGEGELMRCLSKNMDVSAEKIATNIMEDALAFAEGNFSDDIAIVVIRNKGL